MQREHEVVGDTVVAPLELGDTVTTGVGARDAHGVSASLGELVRHFAPVSLGNDVEVVAELLHAASAGAELLEMLLGVPGREFILLREVDVDEFGNHASLRTS